MLKLKMSACVVGSCRIAGTDPDKREATCWGEPKGNDNNLEEHLSRQLLIHCSHLHTNQQTDTSTNRLQPSADQLNLETHRQCLAFSNSRPSSWSSYSSSALAHISTASSQHGWIATSLGRILIDLVGTCAAFADHGCRPLGTFWRAARIGERLSPYVSLCCVAMAVSSEIEKWGKI